MDGKLMRGCPPRRAGIPLSLAFAAVLLWTPQLAFPQARLDPAQSPLAGSRIFGAKGCVKCHAVNGVGGGLGPDLGRVSQRRSLQELAANMWNHMPRMGEMMREYGIERPQFDARDAGDLIAFLFTLHYFDPPGDAEAGERLFTEKQCVVCHQVGLYGGVIGPNLQYLSRFGSPILVASAMWNHGPAMAEAMQERGLTRPTFRGSELTDLISYLESVSPEPLEGPVYVIPGSAEEGRVVFIEKNCIECHSVRGSGGRVATDLAERGLYLGLTEFAAAMWNKAPAMMEAMERERIHVPQLGAGEMADLVAYLYSVQYFAEAGNAAQGRRRLGEKGCLSCHSVGGRGGNSAVDLASVAGMDSPAAVISALWNHSAVIETGAEGQEITWPRLDPAEMADVMAFLQATGQGQR
jgi:mono/diheme cytochrome c family protein